MYQKHKNQFSLQEPLNFNLPDCQNVKVSLIIFKTFFH